MPDHHDEKAPVEWSAFGQVIRYQSERPNHWCREGWAISDDSGRFLDTYWMSMQDAHVVTPSELSTAQHLFWLDDYRELDRYSRGAPDEWSKYAPADRWMVPSQHGLQGRYFIRLGAEYDLATQIQNASDALDAADQELRSAQRRRDEAEQMLRELCATRDRTNSPGSTEGGGQATVTVRVEPEDEWGWDACIVCGSTEVTDRLWLLLPGGSLGRAGWCREAECQDDRAGMRGALPDAISPPGPEQPS